jgi:NitT/TauT family transport system permease protein
MYIAGHRIPLFLSLILWAILWEIMGHTDAKLILPPLSAIAYRIIEIVPTKSFIEAFAIHWQHDFVMLGHTHRCANGPIKAGR